MHGHKVLFDPLDFLMDYETGEIDDPAVIAFGFQQLIDSGMVDHLEENYQQMARDLVDVGLCHW